jgi:hypothetical protein
VSSSAGIVLCLRPPARTLSLGRLSGAGEARLEVKESALLDLRIMEEHTSGLD